MADSTKGVIPFYKRQGETPVEALSRLKRERPELKDVKLSYAGRLDPMADGLLLVLVGESNKDRVAHLALPKTYRLRILFGFSTDTHDILGKLEKSGDTRVNLLVLTKAVVDLVGKQDQKYPAYSSKPISGKALFEWARAGTLDDIEIPTHPVEIYKAILVKTDTVTGDNLAEYIEQAVGKVKGDFRQKEILACWDYNLRATYTKTYDIAELLIECSSGTYMRMIAHELGQTLGIPALALSITRTRIGDYSLESVGA